jgi:hypothetical protein
MWICTVVDLDNGQKISFGRLPGIVAATVLHNNNNVINMKKAFLDNENIRDRIEF